MLKDIVVLLAVAILSRIPRISTDFYCEIRDTNNEIRIIATDEALPVAK